MTTTVLVSEPYTSPQSDDTFFLVQVTWHVVTPDPFWTWHDSRHYGPSLGSPTARHATRESAIAALEAALRIANIKRQTWTREQYEAVIHESGDPDLRRDDRYMESIVKYNDDTWTDFYAFATARLNGIRAESATNPVVAPVRPPLPALVACPSCGMQVPVMQLMAASLGTACPNCYDEMSG